MKKYFLILFSLLAISTAEAAVQQDTLWAKVMFKVVDQDQKDIKTWSVTLIDTANKEHMYMADYHYGQDTIIIPAGFVFRVWGSASSQFNPEFSTQTFIRIKPHADLAKTVYRYTLTVRIVRFPDILFVSGSAELRPSEKAKLDRLIQFYKDTLDPNKMTYGFVVKGYTDSVGTEKSNLALSKQRAEVVWNYLEKRVYKSYVEVGTNNCVKYYGEARPIATNNTEEGRQQNRRVSVGFRHEVFAITSGEPDPCAD